MPRHYCIYKWLHANLYYFTPPPPSFCAKALLYYCRKITKAVTSFIDDVLIFTDGLWRLKDIHHWYHLHRSTQMKRMPSLRRSLTCWAPTGPGRPNWRLKMKPLHPNPILLSNLNLELQNIYIRTKWNVKCSWNNKNPQSQFVAKELPMIRFSDHFGNPSLLLYLLT